MKLRILKKLREIDGRLRKTTLFMLTSKLLLPIDEGFNPSNFKVYGQRIHPVLRGGLKHSGQSHSKVTTWRHHGLCTSIVSPASASASDR
uniref:Transposase n=1 Tax=Steinernema glaseri TaxID=37863 RepID=A0A1I8AGB9_9BILA